ncbi:hypothetical protein KY289_000289 [Solanum tuberosum]|nr:hypothetical protein KY289_000289 [Solanum tuberosum]
MPSAELLAAAAKLTEAQAELRDVELNEDTDLFIGPAPPPPDFVTEVESANEIEHFEECILINVLILKLTKYTSAVVHLSVCKLQLPPERKSGVVRMYSMTRFSKSSKEGRGDTSAWTDTHQFELRKIIWKLQHLLIKNGKKGVDQVSMLNWWYIITKRDDQNLW